MPGILDRAPKNLGHKSARGALKTALALAVAGMILVTVTATTAFAARRSYRAIFRYIPPTDPAHTQIYDRLKENRAAERLQRLVSPFRLPRPLTVSFRSCDGEADAFYGDDEISICYEYISKLWKNMPAETMPSLGIEPIDTVVGPLVDTTLHEFAHALFDMFHVPVLGREEDAADQVAAYIDLHFGKAEARRLIVGTAYAYKSDAEHADPPAFRQFDNEHGTPEERAYNVICIAYGADPKLFGDLVTEGYLPKERAEGCDDEYEQIAEAFMKLIMPHLDPGRARRILDGAWLPKLPDLPASRPASPQPK